MDFLKISITLVSFALSLMVLSGCQVGYLIKNGYHQMSLLNQRQPIEKVLASSDVSEDIKTKLKFAQEAKDFAETELGLQKSENYSTYVQLQGPYISYSVNASAKNELKAYKWWFPIVGSLPYKGYFTKSDAQEEEESLKSKNLDTYLRGVRAYSTLGWFSDPLLSSMMNYEIHEIVNIVIHESVHATIYIKSEADFNERLATFIGNKGAELFFLKKDGISSENLKKVRAESEDDQLFSEFLSSELVQLEEWYQQNKDNLIESKRQERLALIQQRFTTSLKLRLKTSTYSFFEQGPINNARLLLYKMYLSDLMDFQKLYARVGEDFQQLIKVCKQLEKEKDPEQQIKRIIQDNHSFTGT